MRVLIFFVLAFASCKSFVPNTDKCVKGLYVGKDSALFLKDKYGQMIFGNCIRVEETEEGTHQFFDQELKPISDDVYEFDYETETDYGIADLHDIHYIRRVGTFHFSGNKLVIEYSVGEVGKTMSNFRFEGWR
jgi:hypothetical protein